MKAATATIRHQSALVAFLGIFLGGCGPGPATPSATTTLEEVQFGEAVPAHRHGQFYLAGAQPAPDDLATWRDVGVRTVVNLRMPEELDWDEPAAVEELGMKYVSIPFRGPDTLTDETLHAAIEVLGDESFHPILLHCATSNRTGAIWYAHRVANDGLDPDAALEEAKTVGLRTMGFRERIDHYATQVRAD